MKWFKHMSDMSMDVKVRRLIKKYGAEGYGLYCYILELIVRKLETESPLPDLEESAVDIATDMSVDTTRVEEIMWYAIEQGLFGQDEMTGRLVAHKIYKYLQQSETRSKRVRAMIEAYKEGREPDVIDCLRQSQTVSDSPRQNEIVSANCEEQNRTEQNRTEEKKRTADAVHPSLSVPMNHTRYDNLCKERGQRLVDWAITSRLDWEAANGKPKAKDYAAAAATWIRKAEGFNSLPNFGPAEKICPECGKQYLGYMCVSCGWEQPA